MKIKWLVFLFWLFLTTHFAAQAQFVYTVNSDGTLNLAGYTNYSGVAAIPETTNGVLVTSIGASAFQNGFSVTGVSVPDSVTSIGASAFAGSAMTNIVLGTNIGSIGQSAFESCSRLASITLPNSLTNIGSAAFDECVLTNLTIPANVTSIGGFAFFGCPYLTNLTVSAQNTNYSSLNGVLFNRNQTVLIENPGVRAGSYTVPNTVTNVADGAFTESGLLGLIIPPGVISIGSDTGGYGVFNQNPALGSVVLPNTVTDIGALAFEYCAGLTNVVLPNSLTTISVNAFALCGNLTNITFPSSLTSIGEDAFGGCGFTNVLIPASVTNIGAGPFQDCIYLTAINVDPGNPNYSSLNGVLFDKSQTTLIEYPPTVTGNYTITNNITTIGAGAFEGCPYLTTVTIGTNVTSIGDMAFAGCNGLKSVTILNGVTNIGADAFGICSSLTNVTIPSSVTCIGPDAFQGCFVLTNLTIPNGVASIGDGAFQNCYSLTSISIPASVTNIGQGVFSGTALTTITVDPNNPAYASVNGVLFNKSRTTLITCQVGETGSYTVPAGVTSIAAFAFAGCSSLTNVVIPASVTSIGTGAFVSCPNLTAAYLAGNAPYADTTIFAGDDNVTAYYLPGAMGWGPTIGRAPGIPGWGPEFAGILTAFWVEPYPVILDSIPGGPNSPFGFTISWNTNASVVVEACTNLANPVWRPQQTNTLSDGTNYFSDPQTGVNPSRFYRVRSE